MDKKKKMILGIAGGIVVIVIIAALALPKLMKSKQEGMTPVYTPTQIVEEQMKACTLTEDEMFAVITEYFDILNKELEKENTVATVYIDSDGTVKIDVTAPELVKADDHTAENPHYVDSGKTVVTKDVFGSVWSSVQNAYAWLYQNKAVDLEGNIIEFDVLAESDAIAPNLPLDTEDESTSSGSSVPQESSPATTESASALEDNSSASASSSSVAG